MRVEAPNSTIENVVNGFLKFNACFAGHACASFIFLQTSGKSEFLNLTPPFVKADYTVH